MALAIGPAGSGARKRTLLAAHGLGLLIGATIMAVSLTLLAAGVAPILAAVRDAAAVLAAVTAALWALNTLNTNCGLRYPSSSWQVPAAWKESLPQGFTAAAYGILLGMGFLTSVVVPLYWVLVAGSVAAHSLFVTIVAWWIYSGARLFTTVLGSRAFSDAGMEFECLPTTTPPGSPKSIRVVSAVTLASLSIYLFTLGTGVDLA